MSECRIKNCHRHVYDYQLCLRHLKEAVDAVSIYGVWAWQPKDTRKKQIDAVELSVTDEEELETREAE